MTGQGLALATGYSMQLLLESLDAWARGRRPRYAGGLRQTVDFVLPAHISSLAVAMLLYYNDRLWVVSFAAALAIASKSLFRAPVGAGSRHFFNPSNCAISATLLLFPWVGLMMPWQFTAAFDGVGDWVIPVIVLYLGCFINTLYNKRLPLIAGFVVGFVLQLVLRLVLFETPFLALLAPLTGPAAIIYLFFMLPDPATTPQRPWAQATFGFAVALVYLLLIVLHIVFGLFFALTIVCAGRGVWLYAAAFTSSRRVAPSAAQSSGEALRGEDGTDSIRQPSSVPGPDGESVSARS